ncbi:MAG: 4Fe-4S binding protein [Bryobacteraceae bacterium]|nr:4Fe-4S binding protein [Bryobacteraceae bacterium]MDW8380441.1 4Fe-4S binding protein [Bryobacterales bacterium]
MKKPWNRRTRKDPSQRYRKAVQLAFLLLNLWIGAQFYLFVRSYEGASSVAVSRPAGVEGWLPIAGMMNTRYWMLTGDIPVIHPAAMVLFLTFLGVSLLFRKAFCGWLCPVGAISEYLWKLGRETFHRNWTLSKWLDTSLRSLKYILLGLFLSAVGSMSAEELRGFLHSPYGLIADVKMLNFFRFLSVQAAVVIAFLVIASVFVRNFWCRYLCPYGALMGLAAFLSPLRIRRNPQACIDCGKCAKACPSSLAVDKLVQIRSVECIACMECVTACPAENALAMELVPAKRVAPAWAVAAGVVMIFVSVVGLAKVTGHWESPIPERMYEALIPRAHEFGHP